MQQGANSHATHCSICNDVCKVCDISECGAWPGNGLERCTEQSTDGNRYERGDNFTRKPASRRKFRSRKLLVYAATHEHNFLDVISLLFLHVHFCFPLGNTDVRFVKCKFKEWNYTQNAKHELATNEKQFRDCRSFSLIIIYYTTSQVKWLRQMVNY